MKTEPSADEVRVYRRWLIQEISGPEWHRGSPWPNSDLMFGTCFNDDCQGFPVMEDHQVGLWRKRHREGMFTWQALCQPCADELLNDGEA